VANVLPHLAEAMVHVARTKPIDPIAYVSEFLIERGGKVEKDRVSAAFTKFTEALALAEELDLEFAQKAALRK